MPLQCGTKFLSAYKSNAAESAAAEGNASVSSGPTAASQERDEAQGAAAAPEPPPAPATTRGRSPPRALAELPASTSQPCPCTNRAARSQSRRGTPAGPLVRTHEAGPPPPTKDQVGEVASTAQALPARGGAARSLAGQRGLNATARPFVPAVAEGRGSLRCERDRRCASQKVHWPAEPVSATRTIPRIPGINKAKLWCTPGEIRRWRREGRSCADCLSYCARMPQGCSTDAGQAAGVDATVVTWAAEVESSKSARAPVDQGPDGSSPSHEPPFLLQPPNHTSLCGPEGGVLLPEI